MAVVSLTIGLVVLFTHSNIVAAQNQDCKTSDDCDIDRLCTNGQCIEPCRAGVCGKNTLCHVRDHVPLCACKVDYAGHPFTGCYSAPASDQQGVDCNCPAHNTDLSKPKKKRFQVFTTTKMTWYNSLAHCNSVNMRLATIHSQEEHDMMVEMVKEAKKKLGPQYYWIGGADLGQTGNYIWMSTGAPMNYTNFAQGQPDNYPWPHGVEHCVDLFPDTLLWNDGICDLYRYHVCEDYS